MTEQNCKTIAGTIFCCVLVLSVVSCTMYQNMLQLEQDKLQDQHLEHIAPQPNALKELGEKERKRWTRM